MKKQYRTWSPKQSFLLPPSLLDWRPEEHLALFVLDVVGELDLSAIETAIHAKDPRGTRPHDPAMMLALLIYAYCVGVYSSRRIAKARLQQEVEALLERAETVDAEEDRKLGEGVDPDAIPAELKRRESRLSRIPVLRCAGEEPFPAPLGAAHRRRRPGAAGRVPGDRPGHRGAQAEQGRGPRAFPVSARGRALHDTLLIGDWHADSLLWNRDLLARGARGHVDVPRLLEARESGDKAMGVLLGFEGGHPLEGDVGKLDPLWETGYRLLGLTHVFDNELGGSLHGERNAGLTDFGPARPNRWRLKTRRAEPKPRPPNAFRYRLPATAAAAAAVAATTATAAVATTAAAATTTAAALGLGLVDADVAAVERLTVHLRHRGRAGARVAERHETEAARTAGVPVGDHFGVRDLAEALESGTEARIISVPTQATYKQLAAH